MVVSVEGRSLLAIAVILSLSILVIGEFYLIAIFLGGRQWLGRKAGKVVRILFYVVLYLAIYLLFFDFWIPRLIAPQPSSSGYFANGLLFGMWLLIVIPIQGLASLIGPLTSAPSAQPTAAPKIQWGKIGLGIAGCLGLALAGGLLIAGLIWLCLPYLFPSHDDSPHLFQQALLPFLLGTAAITGLSAGLLVAFQKWLSWWLQSWRRERFPIMSATLIGLGCIVIAISAWLLV